MQLGDQWSCLLMADQFSAVQGRLTLQIPNLDVVVHSAGQQFVAITPVEVLHACFIYCSY